MTNMMSNFMGGWGGGLLGFFGWAHLIVWLIVGILLIVFIYQKISRK